MRSTACLVLLLAGCVGALDAGPAPAPCAACGEPAAPSDRRIWRLTVAEYDRTVHDLLGDETAPARAFLPDGERDGFTNQAAALGISESLAFELQGAAQTLAERAVVDRLDRVYPCGEAGLDGNPGCVERFVRETGLRVYRRPLTDDEVSGYVALHGEARAALDPRTAVQLVLETMLQTPSFIFRTELGEGALDPYEIASALSFALWDTMPDEALFAAAASGALADDRELERQARRMLDDPRARPALSAFVLELLDYGDLRHTTRTPDDTPAIERMDDETTRFVEDVVFDGEGTLAALLTASHTFADDTLAPIYGLPPIGSELTRVELDPAQRAGLLTQAGVLTIHASPDGSAPPRRGALIAQRFLCLEVPPPPAGVAQTLPPPGALTTRQRFEAITSAEPCASCHRTLNPLGFALEHYDPIGRFRTHEGTLAIDARVDLEEIGSLEGEVEGAVELAHALAADPGVERCFARQAFRYFVGRREQPGELDAGVRTIRDVRALVLALVAADVRRGRQ